MPNKITMRSKTCIPILILLIPYSLFAQQPLHSMASENRTDTKHVRIVDTLTALEKTNRNPVILNSELDSLIKDYNFGQAQQVIKEPVKEIKRNNDRYILTGIFAILTLLGFIIYLFLRHEKKINKVIEKLREKDKEQNSENTIQEITKEKNSKGKSGSQSLESKISELNTELKKLSKENECLNQTINKNNDIQHDYDLLKLAVLKTYKVKNYPGYDKTKNGPLAIKDVFETENSVAAYAYEKFVKPVLAITDANKNSPAKLNDTDRKKLLDMLVSLSLLYMEYLYLRVDDLSIGGGIAERIQGLAKGNGPDISLLKILNTEFGSRALVLKMALSKADLNQLSYPVFDETNLNNQ
jgi:hypothetical protein